MKKELIKESVLHVAGKPGEELVELLDGNKYANEFLIAKKLGLTINQTRNILYKISEKGLVSSTRKKDKKKGWYTYSWKTEDLKALESLRDILLKRIEQFNHQIKNRETKEFYVCQRCGIEFNEENALLHDFMCPECGDVMGRKDNSKVLKAFKKNVNDLRQKLEEVNVEIEREKEKIVKKRPAPKSRKRATKKKASSKTIKKSTKKPVKKETSKKSSKKKSAKSFPKKTFKKVINGKLKKESVKKKTNKKKTTKKTSKKISKKRKK